MAGSVNRVTLLGNLGKDPEVRTTQSGMKIVNLSLATSEIWTDKASGERKEQTEWHRVVIMNEQIGSVAERYLKNGSKCFLTGKLQTRKWTDQSGQDRYSTEIIIGKFGGELVLLGDPGGDQEAPRSAPRPGTGGQRKVEPRKPFDDLDDEIPF